MRYPTSIFTLALCLIAARPVAGQGTSLRFFGNGSAAPELDRVEISLDQPHRPVDVGAGDFTVEWWMKAELDDNTADPCLTGNDGWIYGNILLDRDVFGAGDWGDWGVSIGQGRLAFGIADSDGGEGLCSVTSVADGAWHHVAATRRASDGRIRLFIDGVEEAAGFGPTGDVSYRDGRTTSYPKDPFLVLGAEKHDAGPEFPSYNGFLDELRLSTTVRYGGPFVPSRSPFTPDAETAALFHFDEGEGTAVGDTSGAVGGPSDGVLSFGGSPAGPLWSTQTPFGGELIFADGFESGDVSAWSGAVGL